LDGTAFQKSLATMTVSQKITLQALYNFTNEGATLIVITSEESVAEHLSSVSSAEAESWRKFKGDCEVERVVIYWLKYSTWIPIGREYKSSSHYMVINASVSTV
jgi:hypothetical protein